MFSKLTSNQKALLIVSGVILFIGLAITSVIVLIINLQPAEETVTEPPLNIEYCGVRLEQICVLSFGRDASGDTIINLFVPSDQFPDFYLKINKLSGEALYECEKNEDVETSVYCAGQALNLGEQIEITLISKDDDIPFAAGKFILTAILISSQPEDSNPPPLRTATPVSATETFTSTPNPSYPNDSDATSTPTSESESTPNTSYP